MRKMHAFFILLLLYAGFFTAHSQSRLAKFSNNAKESSDNLIFIEDISIQGKAQSIPSDIYLQHDIVNNSSYTTFENLNSGGPDLIESAGKLQAKYAMLLDVDIESVKNERLYNFIEEWYGTDYRYGGTTRRGIDCSAFTSNLLLAVYSISVPRTAREQYKACDKIKREDLHEGDLLFFNTTGGISHAGIYLANNYFVHSSSSQGVMVSILTDLYFEKRYLGAGRVSYNARH